MAALAADVNCAAQGKYESEPYVASGADVFYKGAVVFCDTAGDVQVVPADGDRIIGICPYQQTITAAGQLVEVATGGKLWLPLGSGVTKADEGDLIVFDRSAGVTDNPSDLVAAADTTPEAAKDSVLGRLKRATATQMLVELGTHTGGIYDDNIAGGGY